MSSLNHMIPGFCRVHTPHSLPHFKPPKGIVWQAGRDSEAPHPCPPQTGLFLSPLSQQCELISPSITIRILNKYLGGWGIVQPGD
jgi:hypothetical protein